MSENDKRLWGLARSGKFHLLTNDGYYECNRAVGVDHYYFAVSENRIQHAFNNKKVICQNCLEISNK